MLMLHLTLNGLPLTLMTSIMRWFLCLFSHKVTEMLNQKGYAKLVLKADNGGGIMNCFPVYI